VIVVLSALGPPLAVDVEPHTASLFIDGVFVGHGRWHGRLPNGAHELEARELGYVARRAQLLGERGGRSSLRLVVDAEHPRWATRSPGTLWVAALGGFVIAPSLNGGAESSCDRHDCDRSAALGWLAGARVGYELPSRLSFEATFGYLSLGTTLTRTISESYAPPPVDTEYRLEDELSVRAPFAVGGASYRFLLSDTWSVRAGAAVGAALSLARDRVSGTASGGGVERSVSAERSGRTTRSLSLLVLPEAELVLALGKLALGFGIAVPVMLLGGGDLETGDLIVDGACNGAPTIECAPGEAAIAAERGHGPFVAVAPLLSLRYAF
jgi:hypothetical protein